MAKDFAKRMKDLRESRKKKNGKRKKKPTVQKGKPTKKRRTSSRTRTQRNPPAKNTEDDSPPAKKKARTPPRSPSRWRDRKIIESPTFKVGSRISGAWKGPECKGDWYDGVVKAMDRSKKTCHVVYDDGDSDHELSWNNMRVLEV